MIEYEIVKITDLEGNNKKDGRYPSKLGILTTSKLKDIDFPLGILKIKIMNSIYHFKNKSVL